jgi:hypothetical protein
LTGKPAGNALFKKPVGGRMIFKEILNRILSKYSDSV